MKRLVLLGSITIIGCLLTVAHAGLKHESLGDFMLPDGTSSDVKALLPNELHFPSDYVSRLDTSQGEAVRLVGTADDINSMLKQMSYEDIREGIFTITLSNEVGFDPAINKFSGEGEPRSTEQLKQAGVTDIHFTRSNPVNVPTLELTARIKDRHIFLLYIALGKTGSVIKVSYRHPKVMSQADVATWRAFVDGLSNGA